MKEDLNYTALFKQRVNFMVLQLHQVHTDAPQLFCCLLVLSIVMGLNLGAVSTTAP
jgi:hypothetical protein